jgi:hypothetical protein
MDVSRSSGFQCPQVESKIVLLKRVLRFSHSLDPKPSFDTLRVISRRRDLAGFDRPTSIGDLIDTFSETGHSSRQALTGRGGDGRRLVPTVATH